MQAVGGHPSWQYPHGTKSHDTHGSGGGADGVLGASVDGAFVDGAFVLVATQQTFGPVWAQLHSQSSSQSGSTHEMVAASGRSSKFMGHMYAEQ